MDSILLAASKLVSSLGFRGVTTNKIAARAGVSIGSLYHHFPNKEAIFLRLMEETNRIYVQKLVQLAKNSELEPTKRSELILDEVIEFTYSNRKTLRKLYALAPTLGKLDEIYELRNNFARILTEHDKWDEQNFQSISIKNFIVVNAINGIMDNLVYSNTEFSKEEIKEEVQRLVMRYRNA